MFCYNRGMALTLSQVRAIMLASQGLLAAPTVPATPEAVLQMIRRMGILQIDTIHVVARSPYLVLWSRLGSYLPRWLDEQLSATRLFEFWAHAACFIPIEDYPYYRRAMLDGLRGWQNPSGWLAKNHELAEMVMGRIRQEGPLRSADFESAKSPGGWWNWKQEKIALEHLVTRGDLMVRGRRNFQRIYDLRERVLPDWDDTRTPSPAETRQYFLLHAVSCLGVVRASWVGDYFRIGKNGVAKELAALAGEGRLLTESVDGWNDPVYLHPDQRELLARAVAGELLPSYTTLLSPFDPLVWDRKRARELFNFDYSIECYLPAEKRRYGYFSLPILYRGALVGRLAAKARRQDGIFEVHNLVLEPGVEVSPDLVDQLSKALHACADWHATPKVSVLQCSPSDLAALLV